MIPPEFPEFHPTCLSPIPMEFPTAPVQPEPQRYGVVPWETMA